jgi:hypothetical protein
MPKAEQGGDDAISSPSLGCFYFVSAKFAQIDNNVPYEEI